MSTTFEWQVYEETEWERAIESGILSASTADEQATTTQQIRRDNTKRIAYLRWLSLAGVVVAILYLWIVHAPWFVPRADAMSLVDDVASTTTPVRVEADDGYIRFAPVDPAARRPQRLSILSHYIHLSYDAHDSRAVTAAATQIDPLYRALRRLVGLAEPESVIKIDITPRTIATSWQISTDSLLIPSPAFLQAPDGAAPEMLLQSLRIALTNIVLTEGLAENPVRPQWSFLIDGLRKWLQTCYRIQGESQCEGRRPIMSAAPNATPALSLADLTFQDSDWVAATERAGRIRAAESLVAYIVQVYGVEKLPLLLAGLRQHNSWQTLIPAIFGLSAEQFEQEWYHAGQVRQTTAHWLDLSHSER
ncbi:MAG TPA: hypothetical protein PKE45_08620 [Caldilineaceae bacterium]|nr:hypothetical protein [Caldilineaceae bacterium]